MPETLGTQLDAKGWQAGAVIPHEGVPALAVHLARPGLPAPNVGPDDWLVVVSQTCDVVQLDLDKEPLVEVLFCRPIEQLRPDFQGRKSTRRLDFRPDPAAHPNVVLSAHAIADRYVVPRELLNDFGPDPARQLGTRAIVNVQEWYALRYTRPAWPDAFVSRINETKNCRKRLAAALKAIPTDDVEVRVSIKERDEELDDTQNYNVTVFFVVDQVQWGLSEALRAAAYAAHAQFVAAVSACKGVLVNVDLSAVKSGDEFSWQMTRATDEWNFANLSGDE